MSVQNIIKKLWSSVFVPYGTAVLLVVGAFLLTSAMWSIVRPLTSPLFWIAIIITAWKRGFGAGVFASVLSGLLIDYFFIAPEYQFGGDFGEINRLIFFTLEGFFICWLITSLVKGNEKIRESREQLLALSLRQQTLREEERKHIALEIHDELGQSLSGAKMMVHLLNLQIKERGLTDADSINERINDLQNLIVSTIQTVRRISTELRPPILDDLGLVAAIEWQLEEFKKRTSISGSFSCDFENIEISSEFAISIFRIFQECLTNVLRHAEADFVFVELDKTNERLKLRIEDNGKGIKTDDIVSGRSLGIFGMRERARLVGGELQILRGKEGGTTVLLTVPL